ncbi:Uncharacterised protein [Mycobacteroides abscessus subsp. bolletii]|nr:Uncharacterised protein [Mycobacteroides abscessus subsp. bolletii]SKH48021.1 Uncharacterised protein [Mycobacteroides abscessus subsp. bolletii]SKH48276.1 Uncharacterised protein [Mycobacteroides abscessus subsp. bolletii]SKT22688.1 Uncharacterised protein [Mycobacteroides abscessus subsp. abscessus]
MQFNTKDVLPDQYGQAKRSPQRKSHRTNDYQRSDKAARHDQHDSENQAQRSHTCDQEVIGRTVPQILESRRGTRQMNRGILQRRYLERLLGRRPDGIHPRKAVRGPRVTPIGEDESNSLTIR